MFILGHNGNRLYNLDSIMRIQTAEPGNQYAIYAGNKLDDKPFVLGIYATEWERDQAFTALTEAIGAEYGIYAMDANLGPEQLKIKDSRIRRKGGS